MGWEDQSTYLNRIENGYNAPIHLVIARNEKADLCQLSGMDENVDPHFVLVTKDGFYADISNVGIVRSVSRKKKGVVSPLLFRSNAYGNYQAAPGESVDQLIDGVYDTIASMTFKHEAVPVQRWEKKAFEKDKSLFEWRYERILARFKQFERLYGVGDIIPEYNDNMIIASISRGCKRHCVYCPEAGGIDLFTEDQIRHNMDIARQFEEEFHSGHLDLMTEGFLNGSDILYHLDGGVNPIRIGKMFYKTFPEMQKVYAFFGTPTTNETDPRFLADLHQYVNRALIGFESLHDPTSRLLGKSETFADKVEAFHKLQAAGFKVKTIMQVGVTGKGFYLDGQFFDSNEALDVTAERYLSLGSLLDPVEILPSRYTPIPGTPIERMYRKGIIVPFDSPEQLDAQMERFVKKLRSAKVKVELGYDAALEGRKRVNVA